MGSGSSTRRRTATQKAELLKSTSFFMVLESEDQFVQCANFFDLKVIPKGEQLVQAAFIVVVEGELALSTLVPRLPRKSSSSKQHVDELLAIKKKGDFFAKAGRELTGTGSQSFLNARRTGRAYHGSAQKIVSAFDFTTVRALVDTTVLILEAAKKEAFLTACGPNAQGIEKVLNSDMKELLAPIPFLKGLDKQRLVSLSEIFIYETFPAGSEVIKEGVLDDTFYLVLHGKLSVTAEILPTHAAGPQSIENVLETDARNGIDNDSRGSERSVSLEEEEGQLEAVQEPEARAGTPDVATADAAQAAGADSEPAPAAGGGDDGGKPAGNNSQSYLASASADQKKGLTMLPGSPSNDSKKKKKSAIPILKPQPSMRLLRKGSNQLVDGSQILNLADIGPGSFFGEMGMMVKMPRSATVTTKERCLLAKMRGSDFKNFLKLCPDIQASLHQDARERMVRKLYAFRLPFFAGIPKNKLLKLANLCELREHEAGTELIQEGTIGNSFFIIIHGVVNVVQGGNTVVRLAQGAYFGEVSMITHTPHAATITCHSDVVLLSVSNESFHEFFGESEELWAEFEMRALGENMRLEHILKHQLGHELFKQHLENEFAPEHIEFWDAVRGFRKGEVTYDFILSNFIGPDSKTPINVSSQMSQKVIDNPETLESFDECFIEVYNLMKRDNFERFKKTELFKELLDSLHNYTTQGQSVDQADLRRAEMSFRSKASSSSAESVP